MTPKELIKRVKRGEKLGLDLPAAPASDDARDAARYRWLQREIDLGRLQSDNPAVFWTLTEEDGNALDAAIDAAMQEKP